MSNSDDLEKKMAKLFGPKEERDARTKKRKEREAKAHKEWKIKSEESKRLRAIEYQEERRQDAEWDSATQEQKVVHHQYRLYLASRINTTTCQTISQHYYKSSSWSTRENKKNCYQSQPKYRTDLIFSIGFWNSKKQIALSKRGWPGNLTDQEAADARDEFKKILEEASEHAKVRAEELLGSLDRSKLLPNQ